MRLNIPEDNIPVFPNRFPYSHLALDGKLTLSELPGRSADLRAVKSRGYPWGGPDDKPEYRGMVALYTSGRWDPSIVIQHDLAQKFRSEKGKINGYGNLVSVRQLSDQERAVLDCKFNNIPITPDLMKRITARGFDLYDFEDTEEGIDIRAMDYGMFFSNLVTRPTRYHWTPGKVVVDFLPVNQIPQDVRKRFTVPKS